MPESILLEVIINDDDTSSIVVGGEELARIPTDKFEDVDGEKVAIDEESGLKVTLF